MYSKTNSAIKVFLCVWNLHTMQTISSFAFAYALKMLPLGTKKRQITHLACTCNHSKSKVCSYLQNVPIPANVEKHSLKYKYAITDHSKPNKNGVKRKYLCVDGCRCLPKLNHTINTKMKFGNKILHQYPNTYDIQYI